MTLSRTEEIRRVADEWEFDKRIPAHRAARLLKELLRRVDELERGIGQMRLIAGLPLPPDVAGELIRARAALAEQPDPGTLAHLRADLRDAVMERDELRHHYDAAGPEHNLLALLDSYEADVDTAHAQASEAYALVVAAIGSAGAETIEAAVARLVAERGALVARAEKAELELADAESRAAHMLAVIRERDEAKAEAQSQREDGARLRDMLATLRAELERLTAPGEPTDAELARVSYEAEMHVEGDTESCRAINRALWRAGALAGAAHERARQQPAKDATLDDMRKLALAVAARVRQERCLVAQAVAANVDIRVCEDDGGGFMVGVHESGCDEELARCVPAADVPSALARLLGEVSR